MRTHKYLKIETKKQKELYRFIEESNKPREKRRALAIVMSGDKKSVTEIAKNLEMNPDTVYDWLNNYTTYALKGIKDKPISG